MRTTLWTGRAHEATVWRYAPGERHAPHTDRWSRISFVLRGGYREESHAGTIRMGVGDILLKSCEVVHENVFSEQGTVLLALEFSADDPFRHSVGMRCWHKRQDPTAIRMAVDLLEAAVHGDGTALDAIGTDLVATSQEDDARTRQPPAWLSRLKEELESESLKGVDVAARARAAGVHPAHASRLFRRCFGSSLTEHARAHSVRRALELMNVPDAALGAVALAAGFYDQSHMNRAFRHVSGRAPGAHRALAARILAAAG
ncbi:MAG: helix-turn-helix domain-containing protein [Vitreimonas sp.]